MNFIHGKRNITAIAIASFLVFFALNSSLVTPASGGVSGFYSEYIAIRLIAIQRD